MLIDLIIFLFLGTMAGGLAGLLGIGGGIIVVPGLNFAFHLLGFPSSISMHLAAGTSLTIMIFTAISSSLAHFKNDNFSWPLILKMIPWVIIGTISGGILAYFLHSSWLGLFFAFVLLAIGIKTALESFRPQNDSQVKSDLAQKNKPTKHSRWLFLPSLIIGLIAGLIGIGGGVLFIPALLYLGYGMRQVVGVSASLTLPIAIVGTVTFAIMGHYDAYHPHWATGYIYWPAVLCVAPLGIIFANVGEKLGRHTDPIKLKKVFVVLLFAICISMFWHSAKQFLWVS